MVASRPMPLRAEQVRCLLAGAQMQRRLIVKPQHGDGEVCEAAMAPGSGPSCNQWAIHDTAGYHRIRCPYGKLGDQVWVRETLRERDGTWIYSADGAEIRPSNCTGAEVAAWCHHKEGEVCASVHMPRWASRITLEITDVRVQRLQDISEEDAKAEGAPFVCDLCGNDLDDDEGAAIHFGCDDPDDEGASHKRGFQSLWTDSWAANPWVWAISFKRIDA